MVTYSANQIGEHAHRPVGNIDTKGNDDWTAQNWMPDDPEWPELGEIDINMAGACYNCGGKGHPSRVRPSKGGGKGSQKGGFGGKGAKEYGEQGQKG